MFSSKNVRVIVCELRAERRHGLVMSFYMIVALAFIFSFTEAAVAQTWIELAPVGSPPQPVFVPKSIHYDAANNRLIAFYPGNPPFNGNPPGNGNEVWVLTNANGLGGMPVWIKLQPSGSTPFSNGIESVVYDVANNRLIVYGGCFANCSPALSNIFVLSNANGLGGPPVWSQSSVTNPQARVGHSSVYDSVNNLMISFAGQLAFFGTDQNDTRVLSNANGIVSPSAWSALVTSGSPPPIRDEHSAIYDQVNNRMTIFAGHRLISTCCPFVISDYNDLWLLSNANGQGGAPTWTQLSPSGGPPPVRSSHSAVYDSANNRMIVFGGSQWNQAAQTGIPLGDLWQLSNANGLGGTPTWSQLSQSGALPGPRFYHTAAFDTVTQRMMILGGRDQNDMPSNRVWVLILNQSPIAVCQDVTVSDGPNCTANASVDNNSFDPDGDAVTVTQSPPGPYPLGATSVTLTVADSQGAISQCVATVTVVDNTPPVIVCPGNITTATDPGQCATAVTYPVPTASDNCSPVGVACSPSSGSIFPKGTTTVTCNATDSAGNLASCAFTVTVNDTESPSIIGASVDKPVLWPPNHKMVCVTVSYNATDNCTPSTVINCTLSVTSNEPVNGTGDGDTSPDWEIVNAHHVKLRAERAGSGSGRVYTITITCTDSSGNSSSKTVNVQVPHHR